MNFFFNVVEANEGGHGDFSLKDGRPVSGQTLVSHVHTNSFSIIGCIVRAVYGLSMDFLFFFSSILS